MFNDLKLFLNRVERFRNKNPKQWQIVFKRFSFSCPNLQLFQHPLLLLLLLEEEKRTEKFLRVSAPTEDNRKKKRVKHYKTPKKFVIKLSFNQKVKDGYKIDTANF